MAPGPIETKPFYREIPDTPAVSDAAWKAVEATREPKIGDMAIKALDFYFNKASVEEVFIMTCMATSVSMPLGGAVGFVVGGVAGSTTGPGAIPAAASGGLIGLLIGDAVPFAALAINLSYRMEETARESAGKWWNEF